MRISAPTLLLTSAVRPYELLETWNIQHPKFEFTEL